MISVIASVHVEAGRISDFLDIFKAMMPEVRKEKGCIEYFPAVNVDSAEWSRSCSWFFNDHGAWRRKVVSPWRFTYLWRTRFPRRR